MKGRSLLSLAAVVMLASAAHANPNLSLPTGPLKKAVYTGGGSVIGAANVGDDSPFMIKTVAHDGTAQGAAEAASFTLSTLLDAHLDTTLSFTLNGKTVQVSGTFDRSQNAYLALTETGKAAQLYDLAGLVDKPGTYAVTGARYAVLLAGNPVKPLRSQIMLENEADEDDFHSTSVGKLLDAIEAAGSLVTLSDQSYRLFYFRDVKKTAGGVTVDPTSKTFALIYKEGNNMHVFLIPAETVKSDKITVYKAFNNKRIGLRIVGGALKLYENP